MGVVCKVSSVVMIVDDHAVIRHIDQDSRFSRCLTLSDFTESATSPMASVMPRACDQRSNGCGLAGRFHRDEDDACTSMLTLASASCTTERIENLDARKVFLVDRDDDAIVRFGGRGYDHIQSAPRPPCGGAFRYKTSPDERCRFVERQHASSK